MKECPSCNRCFDDKYNACPRDGKLLVNSLSCEITLGGRFILERKLGKGGMAAVFKAKHKFLKSYHAIKIISPEVVREDESLLIRFHQEAVLAASIHHPNVVTVTDFGVENDDMPFLVMEFIEGISLHDYLQKEKRLSPEKAYQILAQIIHGLSQAHQRGIVHRDLKPLNVMLKNGLSLDKAVKVLDFGLAKIKASESYASLVQAKTTNVLGSPLYMSPEQWSNENIDHRADIYSIGVMLFQMLAGEVPFKGDTIVNIMYKHLHHSPPPFSSLGVTVPTHVEWVVQKALAKNQEKRYATVEDFLADYEEGLNKAKQKPLLRIRNEVATQPLNADPSILEKAFQTNQKSEDVEKSYNLKYFTSEQNETLNSFLNQAKPVTETDSGDKLAEEFLNAQNRAEEARHKVNEAEKLAEEFAAAHRKAEEAKQKAVQAQIKLEEDARRSVAAEMESRLAAEREAREKAESEAKRLLEEAQARKQAEEKAKASAQAALEAQQRAEEERRKAEKEAQQRQIEAQTRREAEESARRLAEEAAEAKRKYEEAKREAERESQGRLEAEARRQQIEEEIKHNEEYEAEQRKLVEAKIKEQAVRLQKQAQEAEQKANEARSLIENEAKKRQEAEAARIKAEMAAKQLAEEAAEAKKKYEEAKQEAEQEAKRRLQAEEKRRKIEAEIKRNEENELKERKLAEAEAAKQTKEQAERLQKQAREAEQKANEARSLIENEAKKRQEAEAARVKAEAEARRLADEIIEAQKRLAEAQQFAESESRKREQETEARKKAEDSVRSLSERAKYEEAQKRENSSIAQNNNQGVSDELLGTKENKVLIDNPRNTKARLFKDTSSTEIATSDRFSGKNVMHLAILFGGVFALFVVGVFGWFLLRYFASESSITTNKEIAQIDKPTSPDAKDIYDLPVRLNEKMIKVNGGIFQMGRNDVSPSELYYGSQYPAHTVAVNDFYIDRTEVSNEEYSEFVRANGYKAPKDWQNGNVSADRLKFPVTNVSLLDANAFASWVSKQNKLDCRLPTEEEWEYAARNGAQQNIYPWGDEWVPGLANIESESLKEVGTSGDETAVGKIKDMMGNVMEWTSSPYEYYPGFPENDKGDIGKNNVTLRGLSYLAKKSGLKKNNLLLTFRQGVKGTSKYEFLGFRLVCLVNKNNS